MSTSLVPAAGMVVHPLTGEALQLSDATTDTLARFLDDVRDHESRLRELKSEVSREITSRLDRQATLTWRGGGWKIEGTGATTNEYNAEALAADLRELVRDGVIDKEAAEAAVERQVSFKAKVRGINALLRTGNHRLREVVERHRTEVPRDSRPVSVKRDG